MNIKGRLRVSYIVMLLIPVILLLATGAVIRLIYDPVREHPELPGEFSFLVSDSERVSGALVSAGIIVLIAVVFLLVTNGVLSLRMTTSITRPVRSLEAAALQITNADLDTPFAYDDKDEFQGVFKAFEEMRVRLRDSLKEQQRYEANRRELLASISHDLKTPITAIKGYMEGIRDGIANTPEKVSELPCGRFWWTPARNFSSTIHPWKYDLMSRCRRSPYTPIRPNSAE